MSAEVTEPPLSPLSFWLATGGSTGPRPMTGPGPGVDRIIRTPAERRHLLVHSPASMLTGVSRLGPLLRTLFTSVETGVATKSSDARRSSGISLLGS